MRRALMGHNLYGGEAVRHKLKNRQKMHFCVVSMSVLHRENPVLITGMGLQCNLTDRNINLCWVL